MARTEAVYARLGRGLTIWPLLLFTAFIAVNSLVFTSGYNILKSDERVLFSTGGFMRNLVVLVVFALLVYALQNKKLLGWKLFNRPEYLLSAFYLVLGCAWVFIARVTPTDEPLNMSTAAVDLMQGRYEALLDGGYVFRFPFQLGFIFYLELLYRVFGVNGHLAVALLNVAFAALSYLCVVKIARQLFQHRYTVLLCALLLFFSVYLIPYTTFLYGILPGLCAALFAVLCALRYLESHGLGWLAASALLCTLATILKNNYLIFAVGIFLVLTGDLLRRPKLAALLLSLALLAGSLFGIQAIYAVYKARTGIEINKGVPMLVWVAMGIEDSNIIGPGWYNGYSYLMYEEQDYDGDATTQAAKDSIRQRVKEFGARPGEAASFFYRKLMSEWNDPTYGCFISAWNSIAEGPGAGSLGGFFTQSKTSTLVHHILGAVHFLTYLGAALGLWLRRRSFTLPQLLPAIIALGGVLFFTAWEAKSQYVLPYALLLVPYAAAGFAGAAEALKANLQRKRKDAAPKKAGGE